MNLYDTPPGPQRARSRKVNAGHALQMSEEILRLMKDDGVKDDQLIRAYRDCSLHSLETGDIAKAINYAERELEVEDYCIRERRFRSKKD